MKRKEFSFFLFFKGFHYIRNKTKKIQGQPQTSLKTLYTLKGSLQTCLNGKQLLSFCDNFFSALECEEFL